MEVDPLSCFSAALGLGKARFAIYVNSLNIWWEDHFKWLFLW